MCENQVLAQIKQLSIALPGFRASPQIAQPRNFFSPSTHAKENECPVSQPGPVIGQPRSSKISFPRAPGSRKRPAAGKCTRLGTPWTSTPSCHEEQTKALKQVVSQFRRSLDVVSSRLMIASWRSRLCIYTRMRSSAQLSEPQMANIKRSRGSFVAIVMSTQSQCC